MAAYLDIIILLVVLEVLLFLYILLELFLPMP